jgi:hypothetical protein
MNDQKPSDITDDQVSVDPTFVVQVAVLALIIHVAFGCESYGPYAVIVFFGIWRLAVSGSQSIVDRPPACDSEVKKVADADLSDLCRWFKWRILAAIILLAVAFWIGAR